MYTYIGCKTTKMSCELKFYKKCPVINLNWQILKFVLTETKNFKLYCRNGRLVWCAKKSEKYIFGEKPIWVKYIYYRGPAASAGERWECCTLILILKKLLPDQINFQNISVALCQWSLNSSFCTKYAVNIKCAKIVNSAGLDGGRKILMTSISGGLRKLQCTSLSIRAISLSLVQRCFFIGSLNHSCSTCSFR